VHYSKLFSFQTSDHCRIEGIVLFHSESSDTSFEPMMIKCNPNAGFMELSAVDSPWVEFYHDLGINVCLWNYRGFSKSQGSPNPKVILIFLILELAF